MFNGKLHCLYNWLLTTYSIFKKDPFWLNSFPNFMYMLYRICIVINFKYGEDETIYVKVLFYYILHGFFSCKFQYKKMIYCLRIKGLYNFKKIMFNWNLENTILQKSYFKLWRMKERNKLRLDEVIVFSKVNFGMMF